MGSLTIILSLLPMIFEDFKYRAIHWIWVVLLLALILLFYPLKLDAFLINASFLVIQLTGISLYFSLKERKFVNIINKQLGVGDIVFFIPLLFLFSPLNFLVFFTISIFFSLVGFLFITALIPTPIKTIPLAGCMSISLALTILYSDFTGFDIQNDWWILTILNKISLL